MVVVTNQSCVGKGLIDDKQLWEIHAHMQTLLLDQDGDALLDRICAYTTTKEQQNDPNMKPNPGMILDACRDFDVSPRDCVFVGDTDGFASIDFCRDKLQDSGIDRIRALRHGT